nr:hypothetical protein [Pseudomonas sp. s4]
MSTNPPKISLIDLCLTGEVANLLKQKDGYKEIDHSLLKSLCAEIVDYQSKIDWNAYNAVMIGTSLPEETPGFQKARDLPPYPRPFASWIEFSEQYFGGLSDLEREPKEYRIPYIVEHEYKPDNICAENDRIIFEIKGVIRTLEEAKKYKCVAKQWNVHFVFVLQCRDIVCPWSTYIRKDGMRMTLEEWCTKQGFDYCYAGETEQFRKSDRFLKLVKTVGKGMPSLKDELAHKRNS